MRFATGFNGAFEPDGSNFGGTAYQRPNQAWDAAIQMHTYPYELIVVSITDNILYRSRTALIICWAGNENRIQSKNALIA